MIHLLQRERASVVFYRSKMHMSISHIARVLGRSTRTVWNVLKKVSTPSKKYDLRKWPVLSRMRGETSFRRKLTMLQWCCYAFLSGLRDDIEVLEADEPP